jgi:transcription antitermination protein NusB
VTARNRRPARVVALQALYELDCTKHTVGDVMTARLEGEDITADLQMFAYNLVNGVLDNRAKLDTVIQRYAPEWPLNQMAIVDRNLLRIAIYEFAVAKETPIKVAINEAIELAKEFGSENAARFVNGVLGTLATKEDELYAALGQS